MFFEHAVYKGVLDSAQARTTPIATPYEAVVSRSTKGSLCRIFPDTLTFIQQRILQLVAKDERYDIDLSLQFDLISHVCLGASRSLFAKSTVRSTRFKILMT